MKDIYKTLILALLIFYSSKSYSSVFFVIEVETQNIKTRFFANQLVEATSYSHLHIMKYRTYKGPSKTESKDTNMVSKISLDAEFFQKCKRINHAFKCLIPGTHETFFSVEIIQPRLEYIVFSTPDKLVIRHNKESIEARTHSFKIKRIRTNLPKSLNYNVLYQKDSRHFKNTIHTSLSNHIFSTLYIH